MKKLLFIFLFLSLQTLSLQSQEMPHVEESQNKKFLSQMELKIFHLINQKRIENSLPRLEWNSSIAKVALGHSSDMAKKEAPFSHEGAESRFKALIKVIPSLSRYGENIGFNKGYLNPAESAVEGWIDSKEHYEALMGDFNLTGVGVAVDAKGKYYFTQIFVKTDLSPTETGIDSD